MTTSQPVAEVDVHYCLFRAGGRTWALEANQVARVEPLGQVLPLPRVMAGIAGLTISQGVLVPLISWGALKEPKPQHSLILAPLTDAEQVTHQLAIAVQQVVPDVTPKVPARDIAKHSSRWRHAPAYVRQELWWQQRWLGVLEPTRWLAALQEAL